MTSKPRYSGFSCRKGHPTTTRRFDFRLTEYVEEFVPNLGQVGLEVGAHRVEYRLAGGDHFVTDVSLLLDRIALRRVQAEVCAKVDQIPCPRKWAFGFQGFSLLSASNVRNIKPSRN